MAYRHSDTQQANLACRTSGRGASIWKLEEYCRALLEAGDHIRIPSATHKGLIFLPLNLSPSGNRRKSHWAVRRCMLPTLAGGLLESWKAACDIICCSVSATSLLDRLAEDAPPICKPSTWSRSA
eukprot:1127785-Prymnesium_polylepis.2